MRFALLPYFRRSVNPELDEVPLKKNGHNLNMACTPSPHPQLENSLLGVGGGGAEIFILVCVRVCVCSWVGGWGVILLRGEGVTQF